MSNFLPSPRLTPECVALVKHFEGRKLDAYTDAVGVPTIGYGHTQGVHRGTSITPEQADELLRFDLNGAQADVLRNVKIPLNENEYAALVSLAFNIGGTNFARSRCLKLLNRGDKLAAADEIERFVKGHIGGRAVTLRGLELRRRAEKELFLCPPGEASRDGFMFLVGQVIPLPPERAPDPPVRSAVQMAQVRVTPKMTASHKHLAAAAGLGGGLGVVPVLGSDQPFTDWIRNFWQSTGAAKFLPGVQAWAADWANRLMQLPQAGSVREAVAGIGRFMHSHEALMVFLGAVALFMLRTTLLTLIRAR